MFWKKFPKKKPKKDGWYICTVEVPGQQRYVMDLYWYSESQSFKDNRRRHVFDIYKVLGYDDETNDHTNHIFTDNLCDRTINVKAWKNTPKAYMKGFIKEYDPYENIKDE